MVALEAFVSGSAYIILALFVGTLVTASLVLPRDESVPLRRELLFSARILLVMFLLVAVSSLVVQGMKLRGGSLPTLDILSRYLLRTQSGRIWLVRELYGAFLLLVMLGFMNGTNPARGALQLLFLSLPLVASRSLMSHAAAVRENTLLVISADAIHLMGTALWAGGLAVLFWSLRRGTKRLGLSVAWAAHTVARFSRLALFSVAFLVLTGLYQSWIHVQSWNALFETSYGRALLLKLFLFLSMAGLGALNLLSTKPALLKAANSGSEEFLLHKNTLRRIGAESALGFFVLLVTGLLTVLPPGAHSRHQAAAAVRFSEEKELQPAEGASVKILSPKEGEVMEGDEIPVHFEFKLIKGKRAVHVHAYVDGELMGMFQGEKGTLTGIKPGEHTLEVRAVAENHTTELDATARVHFMVK